MLPNIASLEFENEEVGQSAQVDKTFNWDNTIGDFVLNDGKLIGLEGIEYIKVWIDKALRTKANSLIYSGYGSEHYNLIGRVFDADYAKAEIERTIKEALSKNTSINEVYGLELEVDGSMITVNFTVSTIYGNTEVIISG